MCEKYPIEPTQGDGPLRCGPFNQISTCCSLSSVQCSQCWLVALVFQPKQRTKIVATSFNSRNLLNILGMLSSAPVVWLTTWIFSVRYTTCLSEWIRLVCQVSILFCTTATPFSCVPAARAYAGFHFRGGGAKAHRPLPRRFPSPAVSPPLPFFPFPPLYPIPLPSP